MSNRYPNLIKNNDNHLISHFRDTYYYDYETGELHMKKDASKQTNKVCRKAGDIATNTVLSRIRKTDQKKLYVKTLYDTSNQKTYLAHRVIWALHYGKFPNSIIDHIDGDSTNNLLDNLRSVSQSKNNINRSVPLGHNCNGIKNLHVYKTDRHKMYGITIRYKNYNKGKTKGTEYRRQFVRLRDAVAWRNEHLKKLNMPFENIDFNEWITDTPGTLGNVNPRQKNVTPYTPKHKFISESKRNKIREVAKTGQYCYDELQEKFNLSRYKIVKIVQGIPIPSRKQYDIKKMIELAKTGKYTRKELSNIFNVSYNTISRDLKAKNIQAKRERKWRYQQ